MNVQPLKIVEKFVENSYRYISYLLRVNPRDSLNFDEKFFIDRKSQIVFKSIKKLVQENINFDFNILLDRCKQLNPSLTKEELYQLYNFADKFDNINYFKNRIEENYYKQSTSKSIIKNILSEMQKSDDVDVERLRTLNDILNETIGNIESQNKKPYKTTSDLMDENIAIEKLREQGIYKLSCGIPEIDRIYTYAGMPGTMMTLAAHSGIGKCLNKDSLILTDKGFEYIDAYSNNENGYYEKEQIIYSDNGENITSHFYEEEVEQTIKIKTKWGFEIEGTPEHPVKILTEKGIIEFRKLSELKENDQVCIQIGQEVYGKDQKIDFNFEKKKGTSNLKDISIPEYLTPKLSRFLGYFIANGSMDKNSINLSTKNTKIQEDIKNTLKDLDLKIGKIYDNKDFRIHSIQFIELIKFLIGNQYTEKFTAKHKAVPEFILKGSKENQIEFLRGLFDCDTYKVKTQDTLEYYTASKKLAKEVQLMLLNMGIFSYKTEKYLEEYDHTYHTLRISSEDYDKLIKLFDYKSLKYKFEESNKKRNTNIKIIPYLAKITLLNLKLLWNKLGANNNGWIVIDNKKVRLPFGKINYLLTNNKNITYSSLIKIYNILDKEKYLYKYEEIKELLNKYKIILNSNFLFDTIDNIKINNKKTKVYDFTIPVSHSFYSNGLISHNTTIALNMVDNLVKNGKIVLNFSMDMPDGAISDRMLGISDNISVDELEIMEKDRRLKSKIKYARESWRKYKNYFHFSPEETYTLDKIDQLIYKVKQDAQEMGILPDNEYMVVIFDTNDIIEDFSGNESHKMEIAINKLHRMHNKHKTFGVNLVQLNENKLRSQATTPERLENMYFSLEDIYGTSAFTKRSRLVMVAKRDKALKLRLFPDHEDREQWEFDEDILKLSVVKQNDGQLHSLNFIFNPVNFKITPRIETKDINEKGEVEIPSIQISASEDDFQTDPQFLE